MHHFDLEMSLFCSLDLQKHVALDKKKNMLCWENVAHFSFLHSLIKNACCCTPTRANSFFEICL